MGAAYSYADGPNGCEGIQGPCPRIDGPGHGALVFLYLLWAGTILLYVVHYLLEKKPAQAAAANKGLTGGQQRSDGELMEMASGTLRRSSAYRIEEPASAVAAAASSSGASPTSEQKKADDLYKALLDADEAPQTESLIYIPYRKTQFGTACYYWMHMITAHWVMLFIIILFDVYYGCQLKSVDSLCPYGSYPIFGTFDNNEPHFFTFWCISMAWFIGLFLLRDIIPTWFMQTCSMRDAEYMYVWAKDALAVDSAAEEAVARSCEYTDTEPYQIVKWVRALRAYVTPKRLREGHESTVPVQRNADGVPYFVHEATRYVFSESSSGFGVPKIDMTFQEVLSSKEEGLMSAVANKKLAILGENKIPFECDSILGLVKKEFLSFFYLYQLAMYMVWFWQSYLFVASVEACLVLSSAIVSIYIQWTNEKTISQLTTYETPVSVKRDKSFVTISSNMLVPGDLVLIDRSHWVVPCDLVLVKGSLVMNESGLTGESMPVLKTSCQDADEFHDSHMVVKHTVYAGTTVLQVNADDSSMVLGVVTATGTFTSKGQLISTILYPEVLKFRYEEELEAVIVMLLAYGIVAFIVSLILQSANGGSSSFVTKWAYGMFTASQIFSPLLPVALKVGQIRSSERLNKKGVFCVNPRRIAISGKVNIFCFDKTGTITKDGMEFSGISYVQDVSSSSDGAASLSPLYEQDITLPSSPVPSVVVQCLATCHSLAIFGSDFVGNDVEVKMFTATKWVLRNLPNSQKSEVTSPGGAHQMIVHRKWEFDHARQTMTVVAENVKTKSFHVFCKGSFEKIAKLCDPKSVPANYHSVARRFAMNGGYVLGLAHRSCSSSFSSAEEVVSRDDIESAGAFQLIGLLIFRNEPKPDSRDAIIHLREGVVRPVMITGDNAQCGQYIARKCALVDEDTIIVLGELDAASHTVHWASMTVNDAEQPLVMTTAEVLEEIKKREQAQSPLKSRIEYAVTGNVALGILDTTGVLNRMLPHIRIFARMSPSSKAMVITRFRSLGFVVGMCGDGGNDCGALRAAHAGIALSEAEASVVSPFTSNTKSIQSVVDLLKEGMYIYILIMLPMFSVLIFVAVFLGRASLATSFANYKFLITYGMIFSIVKTASFYYGVLMSGMSYYSIDGLLITTLSYSMTLSHPVGKLSKKRPTASLLGPITLASSLGVNFFSVMCMISCLLLMASDPDYVVWPAEYVEAADWWVLADNWEGTTLYHSFVLFLIASAGIFSFGYLYREPLRFNRGLVVNVIFPFVFVSVLFLVDANDVSNLWHIASYDFNRVGTSSPVWAAYQADGGATSPGMSSSLRGRMYVLILFFIFMAIVWQGLVMEGFVGEFLRKNYSMTKKRLTLKY